MLLCLPFVQKIYIISMVNVTVIITHCQRNYIDPPAFPIDPACVYTTRNSFPRQSIVLSAHTRCLFSGSFLSFFFISSNYIDVYIIICARRPTCVYTNRFKLPVYWTGAFNACVQAAAIVTNVFTEL